MAKAQDERFDGLQAAVIMRFMAAMVLKAGGELIVTEQDLIATTFERLALEMRPDGSARLYLRPDLGTTGRPQ